MQKIVLFIEPNDDAWITPFKIANLFISRFYFEEKASFKIVQIFELGKSSFKLALSNPEKEENELLAYRILKEIEGNQVLERSLEKERNKKGMNSST